MFNISVDSTLNSSNWLDWIIPDAVLLPHKKKYNFRLRWLFGAGVFLFLFALSIHQYDEQEHQTRFTFSNGELSYIGIVQDIPENKPPRSIAINMKTASPTMRKIILYLEKKQMRQCL